MSHFSDAESGCDEADYASASGSIVLINYNANVTSAGCTLYEMVSSAKSANISALLMMRTEDDPNKNFPPNARLYSELALPLLHTDWYTLLHPRPNF